MHILNSRLHPLSVVKTVDVFAIHDVFSSSKFGSQGDTQVLFWVLNRKSLKNPFIIVFSTVFKGHMIHLTQVVLQSESHHLQHREELHLTDFLCGHRAYVSADRGGGLLHIQVTDTSTALWGVSHCTCLLASARCNEKQNYLGCILFHWVIRRENGT